MDIRDLYKDTKEIVDFDCFDGTRAYLKGENLNDLAVLEIGRTQFLYSPSAKETYRIISDIPQDSDEGKAVIIKPNDDLLDVLELMYYTIEPDFLHMQPPTIKTSKILEVLKSNSDDLFSCNYDDEDENWKREFLIHNEVFAYPVHDGGFYGRHCDDEEVFGVVEFEGKNYCVQSETGKVYGYNYDWDDNYRGKLVEAKRVEDTDLVKLVLDACAHIRINPCLKK
jgi:uncharacterized protein YbaR (Trm112 family)